MKTIFYFLCFIPLFLFGQPIGNLCLQKNGNQLEVSLIPTANFQGVFSNIQFTIAADDAAVNLGTISQSNLESLYIPMETAGNDTVISGKKYQTFVGIGLVNMSDSLINKSWQANVPILIMSLTPSSIIPNFEIVNNTYTNTTNRDTYIELNGIDKTGIITCSTSPLAFDIHLTAAWQEKDAFLKWNNLSMQNWTSFVVERAIDNKGFEPIATLNGSESTYLDAYCQSLAQTYITYRIKAVNSNGQSSFSNSYRLLASNQVSIILYPNPVNEDLYIQTVGIDIQNSKIEVYDTQGKAVYPLKFEKRSPNLTVMATTNLTSGVYLLKIVGDKETKIFKFTKL